MAHTLRPALLALALSMLLAPLVLHAQESFPATHIAVVRNVDGVPDSLRGSGIGIFRSDRDNNEIEYRLTLISPNTTVTDLNIRTRTGATPKDDPILQTFVFPAGQVTATTTLTIILPAAFDLIDAGQIYLDIRSEALPDSHMIAQIEPIPTGVSFEIEGSQAVPPVNSTEGRGQAHVVVDPLARRARYHVEWRNLTGPATQAHFHRAAPGENGPVAHALTFAPGATAVDGVWENISADDIRAFREGRIYVNIHTESFKDGEIRGQILPLETFTAAITAANEVPPSVSSQASGTGFLTMVTYPGIGMFVRSMFVVGNTLAAVDAAHIHRGAPGVNGPVILPYENNVLDFWEIERELTPGDISAEDLTAIRTGNAYINAHTSVQQDGEARGQLTPAILNIASSVPEQGAGAAAASMLTARIDRASGIVRFAINERASGADRRILLYSPLGERVADIDAAGDRHELNVSGLPSGIYIAQLLVDDRPVGVCRVGVVW